MTRQRKDKLVLQKHDNYKSNEKLSQLLLDILKRNPDVFVPIKTYDLKKMRITDGKWTERAMNHDKFVPFISKKLGIKRKRCRLLLSLYKDVPIWRLDEYMDNGVAVFPSQSWDTYYTDKRKLVLSMFTIIVNDLIYEFSKIKR